MLEETLAKVDSRFNSLSAESARKLHSSAAADAQTDRSAAHTTARTLRLREIVVNQFSKVWNIQFRLLP